MTLTRCVPPAGAGTAETLAGQYGKACGAASAAWGLSRDLGGAGGRGVLSPGAGQAADEGFHSPTAEKGGEAAEGYICRGKLGAIVSGGRKA